jgi:hypothetical protein
MRPAVRLGCILACLVVGCPPALADGEAELLQAVREAKTRLQQACLRNVRVEESMVVYVKGDPSPARHNHYLANDDAYLTRDWTDGQKAPYVEHIKVNRPDGRFAIARQPDGEFVLGGLHPSKPVLDALDYTFYQTFPFGSLWTQGPVADFLARQTTTFRVVRREPGEIEIDVADTAADLKHPFTLSPLRIVFDDRTYAVKAIRGQWANTRRHVAIEAEYQEEFPRVVTIRSGATPEEMKVTRVHEFAVYRTENVRNTAFGLEQFGLPEPNPEYQERRLRVPRIAWFAGAGVLAALAYLVARRLVRVLPRPVLVLPLIAAFTAGAYIVTAEPDRPRVTIDRDTFDIPELVVGDEHPTPITLTNPSNATLEVVGIGNL